MEAFSNWFNVYRIFGIAYSGYRKRYSTDDLGYYNKGFQLPQFIASNIDSTITK